MDLTLNGSRSGEPGPVKLKTSFFGSTRGRLDAYFFSEIHSPFLLAMLLLNGIFLIRTLGSISELSGGRFEIPFNLVFLFFLSEIPEILSITIPFSFLFASLAAFGRMSEDSETLAPQSIGLSFWRMSLPVLKYGLMLSLFLFFLMNWGAPKLNQIWHYKNTEFIKNVAVPNINAGVINPMGRNSVLYVDRYEEGKLADLLYIDQGEHKEEILLAKKASVYTNRELKLFNGFKINLNLKEEQKTGEEAVVMLKADVLDRTIPIPKDLGSSRLKSGAKNLLNTPRLYYLLEANKDTNPDLWTELYQRLLSPFICFIFGLYAVPLAVRHSRFKKGSGFGLSLVIIGFYFMLVKLGGDAATQGKISPLVGVSAPLAIFLFLGLFLQVGKQRWWNRLGDRLRDRINMALRFIVRTIIDWVRRPARAGIRDTIPNGRPTSTLNFPSKLDIYVTKYFSSIFFLVQCSLVVMLVLVEYTQISKAVHRNNIETDVVLRFLFYKVPEIVSISMFSCLLISTLILFALMSKNQEVTAIRASGGSLQRLCLPLLFCGLLASLLSYYMENSFLPVTNRKAAVLNNVIKDRKDVLFSRDVWLKRPSGEILNYRFYDQRSNRLFGVRGYQPIGAGPDSFRRIEIPSLVFNGTWQLEKPGVSWQFNLGEKFFAKPDVIEAGSVFKLGLDLTDLSRKRRSVSEFSIKELKEYLKYLKSLGYSESHYQTALYAKYAMPLIPFFMMMLAMPLGFQFGRRGTFYGIGAGLLAGLAFLGLFELFKNFGATGVLHPLAAGWSVVVLFGFLALYRFINLE